MTTFAPVREKNRISYRKPELLTPEEYLYLEDRSEQKHEYINGRRYEMSGESPNHNLILGVIVTLFNLLFLEENYYVYPSDQRIKIERKRGVRVTRYAYPDISITSEDREI